MYPERAAASIPPVSRSELHLKPTGFSTTRWSLIIHGANLTAEEQRAQSAFAEVCQIYWRPIYSFICMRGYSQDDAQDYTQEFLQMVLSTNWLRKADPKRGRFRSLLRSALDNFLRDAKDKTDTVRRGSGVQFIRWDDLMANEQSQLSVAARSLATLPAEQAFDLRWAATVVEQALRRLGEECESKGRLGLFEALSEYLLAEREASYVQLADQLGLTVPVVKKQLHNLRRRYRFLLRDEVARTVPNPGEVDEEIRNLCAALSDYV